MRSHRQNQAFTLVELLVVVAIISILIALLVPALKSAKQQTLLTACQANMRNIGLAMNIYTLDNNQDLPYAAPLVNENGYTSAPNVYLPGVVGRLAAYGYVGADFKHNLPTARKDIFWCPADYLSNTSPPWAAVSALTNSPPTAPAKYWAPTYTDYTTLQLCGWASGAPGVAGAGNMRALCPNGGNANITSVLGNESIPLMVEEALQADGGTWYDNYSVRTNGFDYVITYNGLNVAKTFYQTSTPHRDFSRNALYADFHVEFGPWFHNNSGAAISTPRGTLSNNNYYYPGCIVK